MDFRLFIPTYSKKEIQYDFEYKFTIFTSIYNRANTLHRVFESLNNQTFRDFELVLINDGSTDNSHEVALNLMSSATFSINYINYENNKHKMGCYIEAIQIAKGEFLLPLDSDDACIPEALQIFNDAYNAIPSEKKEKISSLTGLCMDTSQKIIGEKFPEDIYYSNSFKQNLYFPNAAERWGFARTTVLRNIIINPNMFSNGLIPEGLIWQFIAKQGFITKYINRPLRIYYRDTENSISIKNHHKNSFGMAVFSLSVLNWFYKDYLFRSPVYFLKRTYTLLRAAGYLEFSKKDYLAAIDSSVIKILFFMGWPIKHLLK